MKEGTGADFSASDATKKIVIGKAKANEANMDFSKLTTDNGYAIKTKGENIYVYGKTTQGTINGIYELLNRAVGLKIYTGDCYTLDYSNGNAVIVDCKSSKSVFNPGIDYNYDLNGETRPKDGDKSEYSNKYQKRMGFVTDYYAIGGSAHAEKDFVESSYFTGTANNGHMTLNEDIAKEAAKWLYDKHIKDQNIKNDIAFGLSDDYNWYDSTDAGQARSNQYVTFMNNVAKELSTIMAKEYPYRTINLLLVAYHNTIKAPSVELVPQSNVRMSVMFAPSDANWYKSLTDEKNNSVEAWNAEDSLLFTYDADAEFRAWKEKCKNTGDIYLWSYHTYFSNYLTPLDCFKSMYDNYKLAAELGVKGVYDNVQHDNNVSTDWNRLKVYLKSELAKNPNMSETEYNQLIDNFMEAYFGVAASYMKEAFADERTVLSNLYTNHTANIFGGYYGCGQSPAWYCSAGNYEKWEISRKSSWSLSNGTTYTYSGKLKTDVYDKMTAALNAIGSAVTGNQLTQAEGEKINNRIKLEMLSIRFVLLAVVENGKADSSNSDTWESLANDCNSLGLTKCKEGAPSSGAITAEMLKNIYG